MRRLRLAVLVAALAVVSAGCIKGKIDMEVERDGTASMTMEIALDPKFADLGSAFGGEKQTPDEMRDEMRADLETELDDLPPGATADVEEIEIHDWPGIRVKIAGVKVDDLTELLGSEPSPGDYIGRDGEGWRFSVSTAAMTSSAGSPLTGGDTGIDSGSGSGSGSGDTSGLEELARELTEQLFGDASITWKVTMPGRVTEHEGGKVSGSTVAWKIELADPPERISASWDGKESPGGGGGAALPITLGAVVVAAAAGVLVWLRRRRTPPAPGSPAEASPWQPTGATSGWPAPEGPGPG